MNPIVLILILILLLGGGGYWGGLHNSVGPYGLGGGLLGLVVLLLVLRAVGVI